MSIKLYGEKICTNGFHFEEEQTCVRSVSTFRSILLAQRPLIIFLKFVMELFDAALGHFEWLKSILLAFWNN